MSTSQVLALKSEKGEILLFDDTDSFLASFKNGSWVATDLFQFDDIEDNFSPVVDSQEIESLFKAARAALNKKAAEA